MKRILFILVVSLAAFSCSKDETVQHTVVLSSQILGTNPSYYVEGFTFESGSKVRYGANISSLPDLILENNINISGNVIGGNFSSPNNPEAFGEVKSFTTSAEAETYYKGLKTITGTLFSAKLNDIKANQVIEFKTRSNKYAKIWIKDVTVTGDPGMYVTSTIEWEYQPDGSKTFSN